jgi:hypothetical protein
MFCPPKACGLLRHHLGLKYGSISPVAMPLLLFPVRVFIAAILSCASDVAWLAAALCLLRRTRSPMFTAATLLRSPKRYPFESR